jgi:hypothetical protein
MLKDSVKVIFEEDQATYKIPRSRVPDYLTKGGKLFIQLSTDTTQIRRASPISGSYIVGFMSFTRPQGSDVLGPAVPVQKEHNWRDKTTGVMRKQAYWAFTVVQEVLEGPFAGMRLFGPQEYRFVEAIVDGESVAGIFGRSARAYIRLKAWLEAAGLNWEEDTIAWSDNVLPEIEELLHGRMQPYLCQLDGKFGWPDTYSALPANLAKKAKTVLKKSLVDYQKEREELASKINR